MLVLFSKSSDSLTSGRREYLASQSRPKSWPRTLAIEVCHHENVSAQALIILPEDFHWLELLVSAFMAVPFRLIIG